MDLFTDIKNILICLHSLRHQQINRFLITTKDSVSFSVGDHTLFSSTDQSIFLLGHNLGQKIIPPPNSQLDYPVDINKINTLFHHLKPNLLRLFDLGISYSSPNIDQDILQIKSYLKNTNYKLYEEVSDTPGQRWFFLGNISDWQNPLFEIVITQISTQICTQSIPHFQIDIDSSLTSQQIINLCQKYLRHDFVRWTYQVADIGTVIVMGEIGNIAGTKIYLSLGTNSRNTKFHRQKLLHLV